MPTFKRIWPNIAASVFRFVKDQPYTVGVVTGPILTHWPQVAIVLGFPDDLTKITLPTLAITAPLSAESGDLYFGESRQDQQFGLDIYGFVVGQGKVNQSQLYRDRLLADLFDLFDQVGRNEGIALYDQASKAEIGQVEVVEARALTLPENIPDIEIERYKFKLELGLRYELELS